jgi:RimJ/RimL family protein N-acetyltransferase
MEQGAPPLKTKDGKTVICPEEIEGLRLVLKPIAVEYTHEIFKEFTPEITTYMFPRSPSHISETEQAIEKAGRQREDGTGLNFVILDKQNNEFLGVCALHGTRNAREPELGIWLKKAAHKKALGREAIGVLKSWCERTLSIDGFLYPVDRRNQPSRKIAEALGGEVVREEKVQSMSGRELDELIYVIPISPAADDPR